MRLLPSPHVLVPCLALCLACSARAQDGGLVALDGGVPPDAAPADASSSREIDVEHVDDLDEEAAREPPERESDSSPQAPTPRADATHAHPHTHVHAHPHEHDEDDQELGVVAEVAPPPEARPVPASASEMDLQVGLLRAIPRRSADQLLTLAPGLTLGNHSGEGHAPSVFLRGFDAGEGQDIETLADGIPLNEPSNAHGHGYADVRLLIPELVRAVHVRQGPFDPRQGDFAVAGTVDYRLGVDERGILARGEYGAFDTRRLVVLWAPERASRGTFAGGEVRDSAGYGPSRASSGAGALGRFEAALSPETSAWVLGGAQIADWSS
ncbi:MAG: TonB-dependent receptor plug domain-containing protein, partial [Sandaracinaceae bacterium]|nr:TonB-dependent receptor plug domain-containing protein [Sandaracinaceae bacterium]